MSSPDFLRFLSSLPRRTVGIVYSFAPATSPRELWYDRWHSEVLSFYGQAIQGLGAEPYFVDVDSFCERAFTRRLPHFDFVFNLNAGVRPISNWTLVPAVASWCDIPILPCEADIIVAGERKDLSNLIAEKQGIRMPETYPLASLASLPGNMPIVAKPRDLGGSEGIEVSARAQIEMRDGYLYQEFIEGYDLTLPLLFDPINQEVSPLPAVAYRPLHDDATWFHSRASKLSGEGYDKVIVDLAPELTATLASFARAFGIVTYCRLDLRVAARRWADAFEAPVTRSDVYFIEINPMPTLRLNINFLLALEDRQLLNPTQLATLEAVEGRYKGHDDRHLPGAWLLACAMFGRLRARRSE